jgi:hypothetical protein
LYSARTFCHNAGSVSQHTIIQVVLITTQIRNFTTVLTVSERQTDFMTLISGMLPSKVAGTLCGGVYMSQCMCGSETAKGNLPFPLHLGER